MEAGEGLALGSKETVNSLGSDGSHIENSTVNEALTYSMSRKSQIMVRYVLKKSGCLYQSIWIGEKSLYALIKQIKEPEVLEILKALCSYSIYIKIDHEIIDKRIHKPMNDAQQSYYSTSGRKVAPSLHSLNNELEKVHKKYSVYAHDLNLPAGKLQSYFRDPNKGKRLSIIDKALGNIKILEKKDVIERLL